MKCDLPGLYVQPKGGIKGLRDGKCTRHFFHMGYGMMSSVVPILHLLKKDIN